MPHILCKFVPIDIESLKSAMAILVKRHPMLRMRIQHVNAKYIWNDMEHNIDMDICENISKDWHPVFTESLKHKFDLENGPLWGITLIANTICEWYDKAMRYHVALLFRFSHTIIDGQG